MSEHSPLTLSEYVDALMVRDEHGPVYEVYEPTERDRKIARRIVKAANNHETLAEALERIEALSVLGKADEDIPDDKEDAYLLGYADALIDVRAAARAALATLKP